MDLLSTLSCAAIACRALVAYMVPQIEPLGIGGESRSSLANEKVAQCESGRCHL
jgi:hypothetical protein